VRKNRTGRHRWSVEADVVDLVRALARRMPDPAIAAVLNRAGMSTGKGNFWTRSRVAYLRGHNEIAVYREGERAQRGEATLDEAVEALSVSPAMVRRLIADGVLSASRHCAKARLTSSRRPTFSGRKSSRRQRGEESVRLHVRRLTISRRSPWIFNEMARRAS
jgi:hypothetical protein